MAKTIDERIVDLQFNNKQFETGIKDSLTSIENLKKGLGDMDGASKGLDAVGDAAEKTGFSFSTLEVIAATALAKLTSAVIDFGVSAIKSLSIDQVTAGFRKYEQQVEAVQFIMNATGHSIDEVTSYLDRLMWFTDETSYSYMDMVNSIGKFTATGVKLDVAVEAMQGISTWAAISGRGIQGAETAMDALSVSMGTGAVKLKEWNRIKDANMGTMEFKETVIATAFEMGTLTREGEKYIAKYVDPMSGKIKPLEVSVADFTTALKAGWFNSEVLLASLGKYGAYATQVYAVSDAFDVTAIEAMRLIDNIFMTGEVTADAAQKMANEYGVTTDVVYELANSIADVGTETMEFGRKAFRASQEAKTFTDVVNFLKDAISTKWMQTFDLIIGNFEEARDMWSDLSEILYDVFVESGNIRNEMLKVWKDMGGRDVLLEGIANIGRTLLDIFWALKEAWENIFPPTSGERLFELTEKFRDFTEHILLSDDTIDKITRTLSGLFAVLDIVKDALGFVIGVFVKVVGAILPMTGGVLDLTAGIGDFLVNLRDAIKDSEIFGKALESIDSIVDNVKIGVILGLAFMLEKFADFLDFLAPFVNTMENFIGPIASNILLGLKEGLNDGIQGVIDGILNVAEKIVQAFKDFFGIHSPSELMKTLGSFIIAGLIVGITMGSGPILAAVAGLGAAIFAAFQANLGGIRDFLTGLTVEFDFGASAIGKAFANIKEYFGKFGGIDLGPLKIISDSTKELFKPFEAVGNLAKKVFDTVKTVLAVIGDAINQGLDALGIENLEQLIQWLFKGGLLVLLDKFIVVIEPFSKAFGGFSEIFDGLGDSLKAFQSKLKAEALLSIAIAMGVLTASLFALTLIAWEDLLSGIVAMGALVGVLTLLSKLSGTMDMVKLGGGLSLLGIGLLELAGALAILSLLSWESIGKGIVTITALLAVVTLMGNLTFGDGLVKMGAGLTLLGVGLTAIIAPLLLLALIPFEWIGNGLQSVAAILLVVAAASIIADPSTLMQLGVSMALIAVGLTLLVIPIVALGLIPFDIIGKGLLAMAGALATVAIASQLMKPDGLIQFGAALAIVSAALIILGAAFLTISFLTWEDIAKGLLTMSSALIILVTATNLMQPASLAKLSTTLISLAAIMVLVGGLFLVISAFDIEGMLESAASIALVLLSIAAFIKVMENISFANAAVAAGALALFGAALVIAMAPFIAISFFDVDGMIETSASISLLMIAIAAFIKILDSISFISAIESAIMLSLFAVALTLLTAPFIVLKEFGIEDTTEIMLSLSGLMTVIGAFIIIIGNIPISAGITAVANLAIFVGGLTALLATLGGLAQIPGFTWIVDEGIDLLIKLGSGLGEFVGAIIGGVLAGISTGFPTIGENLSLFMTNLQPFIDGAKQIDDSVMTGVESLVKALLALTVANLVDGIAGFLTGGKASFVEFGKQLAEFAPYFADYYESIKHVDADVVAASSNAALALAEMASKLPAKGGALQDFIGTKDLSTFAQELADFGPALSKYADSVSGLDGSIVENSTKAALALAELANKLPAKGGVLQEFMGTKDLSTFAEELSDFGPALKRYSESVSGLDGEVVVNSANAAMALAKLADNLPAKGGAVQDWMGTKDLSNFAKELSDFGPALSKYAESIKGINTNDVESSANASLALANLADNLPAKGGAVQGWMGSKDLSSFAKELSDFGPALKKYADSINGINSGDVVASTSAAEALAGLADKLPAKGGAIQAWTGSKDLSKFANELVDFGPAMKKYADSVKGIAGDSVMASASAAQSLSELANNLPSHGGVSSWFSGSNTISDFGKMLSDFGPYFAKYADSIRDVKVDSIKAVSESLLLLVQLANDISTADVSSLTNFGYDLAMMGNTGIDAFIKAFTDSKKRVEEAINKMIGYATTEIENLKSKFENAGNAVIDGFIKGIKNKEGDLKKVAQNLGSDTLLGTIKDALGIKSPSKEMEEVGTFTMEGLNEGLSGGLIELSSSARDIASNLRNSLTPIAIPELGLDITTELGDGLTEGVPSSITPAGENIGKEVATSTADGIKENSKTATKAAKDMAKDIFDNAKEWIKEYRDSTNYLLETEIEMWEELGANYKKGSKERKEINKEISDLKKTQFEEEKKIIDHRRKLGQLSLEEELKEIEILQNRYEKGSEARKLADKALMDAIVEHRNLGNLSLKEELSIWEEIQDRYVEGTDERRRVELELYEVKKKINKEELDNLKKDLEHRRNLQTLSLKDEMKEWKEVQGQYAEGSEERKRIDLELLNTLLSHRKTGDISLKDEYATWEYIQSLYAEGTDEQMQVELEMYELKKKIKKEELDDLEKHIDQRRNLQTLSLEEEIAVWEQIQLRYGQGTEERKRAEQELINAIIEHRKLGQISLVEEYQAWEYVQSLYAEGSDERMQIELELFNLKVKINEEQKKLAEEQKKINEEMEKAEESYAKAVETRAQQIANSFSLFSEMKEKEKVAGQDLIKNLQDQVKELESWSNNITTLSKRGIDEGLLGELRKMGPSANAEITALSKMTDTELTTYQNLWKSKNEIARKEAITELQGLRKDTDEEIKKLREKLEELTITDVTNFNKSGKDAADAIIAGIESKIAEIKASGETLSASTIEGINANVELYNQTGKQLGIDFSDGLSTSKNEAKNAGEELTNAAEEGIKSNADVYGQDGELYGTEFCIYLSDVRPKAKLAGQEVTNAAEEGIKFNSETYGQTGGKYGLDFSNLLSDTQTAAKTSGQNVTNKAEEGIKSNAEVYGKTGEKYGTDFSNNLSDTQTSAKTSGQTVTNSAEEGIKSNAEVYGQTGEKYGLDFSNGIDSQRDAANTAGVNISQSALSGIQTILSEFFTMGQKAGQDFANGLSSAMTSLQSIVDQFRNLGEQAGYGFANGLYSTVNNAIDSARSMADSAAQEIQKKLEIKSPSKLFYRFGAFTGLGFANGLLEMSDKVENASSEIGSSAIDGIRYAIDRASDIINEDIDVAPVITPVIDLSNIQNGMNSLRKMLSGAGIDTTANINMRRISSQMGGTNDVNEAPGCQIRGETKFEFTQNNYSPKALSRLEIYRQTKNQFAQMKGLVEGV